MANSDTLFQELLSAGANRKYLLEVRTTERGDRYLVIDEIRRGTTANAGLSSIYIFQDLAPEFLRSIQDALTVVMSDEMHPPIVAAGKALHNTRAGLAAAKPPMPGRTPTQSPNTPMPEQRASSETAPKETVGQAGPAPQLPGGQLADEARKFWNKARRAQLETDYYAGKSVETLAAQFSRNPNEIRQILQVMGLE